jgi:peroxiredoxin
MAGSVLGFAAAAILAVAGVRWLHLMRQVRIPQRPTPYLLASGVAAVLGAAAFLRGPGIAGGIAAAASMVGGLAFLALYAASGQAKKVAAVAVGGRILDFVATDDQERPFSLASLRGSPFLLKFFRGHWCPYCVAELRRWEELRPELDARGIAIVAVCADSAEKIRQGRARHGLQGVLVPDPHLEITDLYNLRNPRNFAPQPGIVVPLPIPTTLLVDAAGIVRWIDQSTDYMRRSDPERVLAAIREHLDDRPDSALPLAGAQR